MNRIMPKRGRRSCIRSIGPGVLQMLVVPNVMMAMPAVRADPAPPTVAAAPGGDVSEPTDAPPKVTRLAAEVALLEDIHSLKLVTGQGTLIAAALDRLNGAESDRQIRLETTLKDVRPELERVDQALIQGHDADPRDRKAVDEVLKQINDNRAARASDVQDMVKSIRAALTSDQLRTLREMKIPGVVRSAPSGGSQGGSQGGGGGLGGALGGLFGGGFGGGGRRHGGYGGGGYSGGGGGSTQESPNAVEDRAIEAFFTRPDVLPLLRRWLDASLPPVQ